LEPGSLHNWRLKIGVFFFVINLLNQQRKREGGRQGDREGGREGGRGVGDGNDGLS